MNSEYDVEIELDINELVVDENGDITEFGCVLAKNIDDYIEYCSNSFIKQLEELTKDFVLDKKIEIETPENWKHSIKEDKVVVGNFSEMFVFGNYFLRVVPKDLKQWNKELVEFVSESFPPCFDDEHNRKNKTQIT